jgi:hypothetical protein
MDHLKSKDLFGVVDMGRYVLDLFQFYLAVYFLQLAETLK